MSAGTLVSVIPTIRPVILSGGAGTRLWPLSTPNSPKQFLRFLGEPLFEATMNRLQGLAGVGPAIIVTGGDHVDAVDRAVGNTPVEVASVLVEPAGRNTAPAVVAAALICDPGDVLVVLPADHMIADVAAFSQAVTDAVALALGGALVTFGVVPSRAETGYGYIEKGDPVDLGFLVARFKEKPDPDEATRLFADGAHLWNSGMFVFTAGRLLEEAKTHVPDLVAGVRAALPSNRSGRIQLGDSFSGVTSISIDHAVMERTGHAVVIPLAAGWSDIGSWQSVWELTERDASGNALVGDVTAIDVTGSYVRSSSKKIAIAGVEDLVVVETPDVVLVVPRARSQLVRELVARSQADQRGD